MNSSDVEKLIDELSFAAQMYYQEGKDSPLEDEEFDEKVDLLVSIFESGEFPELFEDGSKASALIEHADPGLGSLPTGDKIILHSIPMLSLGKAKTVAEVQSFIRKVEAAGAKSFSLQAKLDGIAISAVYVNGKLDSVSTRGNGTVGEDSMYLADTKGLTIVGLPKTIQKNGTVEIRGEIFFTDAQFADANEKRVALGGEPFKNARNAVSGLVKKAKLGLDFDVEATFTHYAIIVDNVPSDLTELPEQKYSISTLTSEQVNGMKITGLKGIDETMSAVQKFGELRPDFTIPTDGVVIKPENEGEMFMKMGANSHHPSSQIAFKYPGEAKITTITGYSLSVGGTGKLTPVAHFEPISVMGSELSNVTLNNFSWAHNKGVKVGSVILVTKANDVIPFLKKVISNPTDAKEIPVPTNCPECNSELVWDKTGPWPPLTLRCENFECPSRKFFNLTNAVSKGCLDIDGLAVSTLQALFESGRVKDVSDLFTLSLEELASVETGKNKSGTILKFGMKRAQNVINQYDDAKKRQLYRILLSLTIPMLGGSTAKLLVKKYGGITAIQKATIAEVAALEGLGEIKAKAIVDGIKYRSNLIEKMQKLGFVMEEEKTEVRKDSSNPISGKTFAISGSVPEGFSNRNAWVEYIESQGGIFHASPKKETNYIIADPEENSSKIVKAKSLGIEFVKSEDFNEKFAI